MSRIELHGVAKRWGDVTAVEPTDLVHRRRRVRGDPRARRAAASRRRCSCSPASTRRATGEIRFDGAVVNEVEARDRNVGIVFQSYALYPHMTVRENILFPLRFKKVRARRGRRAGPRRPPKLVQVQELLDRRPAQLSGGQQQRVALARALVKEPQAAAARRAAVQPRRLAAPDDAQRDPQPAAQARRHHDPRHPRPDRGHDDGRPGDLHEQGPHRADRHRRRPLPPAAEPVRRRASSARRPSTCCRGSAEAGRLAIGEATLLLAGPARRARSCSASGPKRSRLGDGAARRARIDDLEPHGRETIYHLDTALGPLRALEPGARGALSRSATPCRSASAQALLFDAATGRRIDGCTLEPVRSDSAARRG